MLGQLLGILGLLRARLLGIKNNTNISCEYIRNVRDTRIDRMGFDLTTKIQLKDWK